MELLIRRFYKIHFAGSSIKSIWTIITPLLLSFAIILIFKQVFLIKETDMSMTIISGYIFWQFISSSILRGHRQIKDNRLFFKQLINTKTQFLISYILFNFLLALPGILLLSIYSWTVFSCSLIQILLFICSIIFLICCLSGILFMLASWTVFYPDISHGIETIFLFLLWLSPVFYKIESLPENIKAIAIYNPLAWFLDIMRYSLGLNYYYNPVISFSLFSSFSICVCISGFFYYKKHLKELIKFL